MDTLMLDGPLLDSARTDQEDLVGPDDVFPETPASQGCTLQGAQLASPFSDVSEPGGEDLSAFIARSLFGAVSTTARPYDKEFSVGQTLVSRGITTLARGNQVLRDVVESIAIQVVSDEIDASGMMSISPLDIFAAPVAGMPAWPDVIKEDLAMLFDSSECPCQRVSMLAVQDSILDPVALIDLHAFLSSHNKYTSIGA